MKQISSQNGSNKASKPLSVALASSNGQSSSQGNASGNSSSKLVRTDAFDQPVVLQQTALWSRAIVWGIVGVTSFTVIWAAVAQIEEAVPATGQLEPLGAVQEVQAPVGGVVEEILVQDGQRVERGEVLLRLDPTATEAQQRSLQQVRNSLVQEVRFYRSQLTGQDIMTPAEAIELNVPPELLALTANRAALLAENQLYRAQITGSTVGTSLSLDEQARLQSSLSEANSRATAAQLEVSQLRQQLAQAQTQLTAERQALNIDESILSGLRPLQEEGGIARVQVLRQEQEVLTGQAEVDRLTQEQQRLQLAIAQAQEKLQNTLAVTQTDWLNRIAENDKRIAEINTQINKAIVENEKQIAELDSQLAQAALTLRYQEIQAPVGGTIFDLQAKGSGFVANPSEPILKIVPDDALIARVFITNKDIGFLSEGMSVDVRVDSFPFSEFGDIKGELVWIGSDAMPPTEVRPYYTFPARVRLDRQTIEVSGRDVRLQSGMSISANILIRKRSVLSIFTDMFSRKVESLKGTR